MVAVLSAPSLDHLELAVVALDRERDRHDAVARLDHRQDALDALLPLLLRPRQLLDEPRTEQLGRAVVVQLDHLEEAGAVRRVVRVDRLRWTGGGGGGGPGEDAAGLVARQQEIAGGFPVAAATLRMTSLLNIAVGCWLE